MSRRVEGWGGCALQTFVAAALLASSCRAGERARPVEAPKVAPTYADRQPQSHADPVGVYWEGDRLWTWSDSQPEQRSYLRTPSGWRAGPTRRGPAGTQRCVVGQGVFQGHTYCVGRHQNGGLLVFAQGSSAALTFGALPLRAGFRDLLPMPELGLLGVLDAVTDQLLWLDRSGAVVGQLALASSSYRIGSAGGDRVFVLSGSQPALSVSRVGADGSSQVVARWQRTAPLRDAVYDELTDVLWVVGPEDHMVQRKPGPLQHLGSELLALDGAALRRGEILVQLRFDLQALGLADPTRVTSLGGQVVVSLTGSDRLAWLSRVTGSWKLDVRSTGLAPIGLSGAAGSLAVACRLDDRLYVYEAGAAGATPPEVIVLDDHRRDAPRDLGERLFYAALLWSQSKQRPFTCNSCHWDTESDRRKHPGLLESRWEQTRPLGGVGALAPIFTPGQSSTLAEAVDGLVRILDDRYWRDHDFDEGSIELRVKGGETRRLGPGDKRRALSAFLSTVPVSPGPYLRADTPELRTLLARGAQLFIADCADCHAPSDAADSTNATKPRSTRSPEALLETLQRRPLVLGARGFARTGPGPSFTEIGNRISPLMGLSRGGPYFSSGSVPTLRGVLEGFARTRPGVHTGTRQSTYDSQQVAALEAFLSAL